MATQSAIATPTDWAALTRGYDSTIASSKNQVASFNSQLSDLQNKLSVANQNYTRAANELRRYGRNDGLFDKKGNLISQSLKYPDSNREYTYALALKAQADALQARIAEATKQRNAAQSAFDTASSDRANVPAKLAEEQKLIAEQKAKSEFDANVLAEDIQIQERASSRNAMANQTLARMNQSQQAEDLTKKQSEASSVGAAGGAYNIQKQQEAGQQKVGAAMSATPTVGAFSGKAAAVSPVNATSQTANTGVVQPLNKSIDLKQIVSERANKDATTGSSFTKDRSKSQNVGMANSFGPPKTEGIQIGEMPINKFGGE